jgi:exonuclease III
MNIYNLSKECKALAIWQQNLNKSPLCEHGLKSSGRLARHNIDIIALQELSINFLHKMIMLWDWTPIYPSTHKKQPEKTRMVTLNRGDLLTENWEQLDFLSGDVTALHIKDKEETLTMFNIYNNCEHNSTLEMLTSYHRQHTHELLGMESMHQKHHLLWLGDFNRHHPYWDNTKDNRLFTKKAQDMVEVLLKTVADLGMDMVLAKGIPTHCHHITKKWTRLDQVFTAEHTVEAITSCDTLLEESGVNTNHMPIATVLDFELTRTPAQTTRNFCDMDWESFNKTLEDI